MFVCRQDGQFYKNDSQSRNARPLQPGPCQKFLLACIETYFTVNVAPVLLPVSGFINAVKNKTN